MKIPSLLLLIVLLGGCNNGGSNQSEGAATASQLSNGQYAYVLTAQDVKTLHYTIENFTLLNKKKFENLPAYQEFGALITQQAEQIAAKCELAPDVKTTLCNKLNRLKAEAEILQSANMQAARNELININQTMAEIDSLITYKN